MTKKLTKGDIDRATYHGGEKGNEWDVRWDSLIPGFGVRIYPSGRKAFILRYRASGSKRLLTLGMYGVLTLDQARHLARQRLGEVSGGEDPLEKKRKAAQGETMKALCEAYLERHASRKRSTRDDQRRITQHLVPAWGQRKVDSIARADVAALHSRIGERHPYEANRTVALLGKMFELARRWGFLPETAANPARGIDKFQEKKRDRWVTPEELPRLAAAIAQTPNLYIRAAIWLYLLTGVRREELLRAQWADVDVVRCELHLSETKAGRTHYVPLSAPALALLHHLPRQEGNPYLLPGQKPGQHLVNISKAWKTMRTAASVDDVRIHDLRRTVGSWLAQTGSSLPLIGRVLNHTDPKTTAIYARLGDDPARQALAEHGERLTSIAGQWSPTLALPASGETKVALEPQSHGDA
ncbi:MAG: site-specific integrase [Deltaproteobacteria bacterium]|nr:site-specific integrase [Deltaproteobacteria bacterium]